MSMTADQMGVATQVSDPSASPDGGVPTSSAAPGAAGPGGQMSITAAALTTIGVPVLALVGLRLVFGARDKLPPLRVDATNVLNIYFSWLVANGTVKVLAYRFHGHKIAQAYLLLA